jgi:ATP phosphoribosyltransferase regulatory subunit
MARGGRYDAVGEAFGRARPACGFSADLKTLLQFGRYQEEAAAPRILAPADADPAAIRALRAQGRQVVQALPGQTAGAAEMGCGEVLRRHAGGWVPSPA